MKVKIMNMLCIVALISLFTPCTSFTLKCIVINKSGNAINDIQVSGYYLKLVNSMPVLANEDSFTFNFPNEH